MQLLFILSHCDIGVANICDFFGRWGGTENPQTYQDNCNVKRQHARICPYGWFTNIQNLQCLELLLGGTLGEAGLLAGQQGTETRLGWTDEVAAVAVGLQQTSQTHGTMGGRLTLLDHRRRAKGGLNGTLGGLAAAQGDTDAGRDGLDLDDRGRVQGGILVAMLAGKVSCLRAKDNSVALDHVRIIVAHERPVQLSRRVGDAHTCSVTKKKETPVRVVGERNGRRLVVVVVVIVVAIVVIRGMGVVFHR